MFVERADEGCLREVAELLAGCIARMRASGIEQWDEIYPAAEHFRADCAAGNLFVLRDAGGKVVGCGTLDEKQSPEYEAVAWTGAWARVGVVHRLMIAAGEQGKGRAKGLMEALEAEAARRGYEGIRLDAFLANPGAMKLYAGLGYRQVGEVRFRKGMFACFEKGME